MREHIECYKKIRSVQHNMIEFYGETMKKGLQNMQSIGLH